MWLDPCEPKRQFEDGIFGFNPWGLSYHLEPDGYRAIQALRGPRLDQYETLVPKTVEVARSMYATIPQRHIWGTQIAPGRWSYERMGAPIKTANGARKGNPIQLGDVLKHCTGRSRYSRGTTDLPVKNYSWDAEKGLFIPNYVATLRLDIDLDRAWLSEDDREVMREVISQRRIVEAAGLPYRVFRTGSRGVQIVVPLPLSVPPSLASVLMHGIRSALEERGPGFTAPDKDNLQGLMRLPGGVHASSGDLGLWIDANEGRLFPLAVQADLMSSGFLYPEDGKFMSEATFEKSAVPMLRRINSSGFALHELLDRETALLQLRARPDNPICQGIKAAHWEARAIRAEHEAVRDGSSQLWLPPSTPTVDVIQEQEQAAEVARTILESNIDAAEAPSDASAPIGTVEWAKAVWLEAYRPGGHWEWISMGGKQGILAAAILFGADRAEEAMLNLSRSIGARSGTELREREHTIRRLWETFSKKNFAPNQEKRPFVPPLILGSCTSEIEDLARRIVDEMLAAQPKPRWNRAVAEKLAIVLLIGIRDSGSGRLRASFGTLADSINHRWPEGRTNRQRISEMVPRMTTRNGSLVHAFYRVRGEKWRSEPDEYGCGSLLKGTPLYEEALRKLSEEPSVEDMDFVEVDTEAPESPTVIKLPRSVAGWDGEDSI